MLANPQCRCAQGTSQIVAIGAGYGIFLGDYTDQIQHQGVAGDGPVDHILEHVSHFRIKTKVSYLLDRFGVDPVFVHWWRSREDTDSLPVSALWVNKGQGLDLSADMDMIDGGINWKS